MLIVLAADHTIKIVSDSSIPVDVLVCRTWLDLPHVNYFKLGGEIVFDLKNRVQTNALDVSRADDDVYGPSDESSYNRKRRRHRLARVHRTTRKVSRVA